MTSILITRGYSRTQIATFLALAMAAVVGAALAFEHIGGYIPCKLCLEQRIPYYVGAPLMVMAALSSALRWPVWLTRGLLVIGGLLGGSIADAHDRRLVALLATSVLWLTTGAIALQSWLQLGNVWVLYLLVAAQSGAQAINQPARSAILPMLVRKELLPAANALSMMSFGLAMTAGPLLAGVLVAWVGFAWTYTLDFASFAFVLWAVYRLPPLPQSGNPRRPGLRSVVEGFRFLGTRPNVRMTFVIDLVAMILAQPRALMPAIGAVMIGGGEARWAYCWPPRPLAPSWPGCSPARSAVSAGRGAPWSSR